MRSSKRNRPILLLDVMDTLVTEPFVKEIPAFFGMDFPQLKAEKHPTSWIEFEKGTISEAEYFASFFKDGREIDGAGLRRRLRQAYRWLDGMEELLAELHQTGYEMHALSNYSIWYEMIEESLGLSRYLRWTFVSCLTGVRKPAPEAYLGAARFLQVPPDACLFIDDRPVNVEAAQHVGMDAILRTDAPTVRGELVRRGVLPA